MRTTAVPRLRRLFSERLLAAARLFYAGSTGIALVLTTAQSGNASTVGQYVYATGIAGALTVMASLGADRAQARRVAAGLAERGLPRSIVALRAAETVLLLVIAILFGAGLGIPLVAALVVILAMSRVVYGDLEAVWIASGLSERRLAAALVCNGVITGAAIYVGVRSGLEAILFLSLLGNIVASLILLGRGVSITTEKISTHWFKEASGYGGSAALSVIYSRVDLAILALTNVSLQSVAIYGVVTRVFDGLAIARGAFAQQKAREIAPLPLEVRQKTLIIWSNRVQKLVLLLVSGAVLLGLVAVKLPSVSTSMLQTSVIFASLVALPLFFSHSSTVAMVLGDGRTHRLFIGSIITCILSTALKWVCVTQAGIPGAVVALGLVEAVSFGTFLLLYWKGTSRRDLLLIFLLPFAVALIPASAWAIVTLLGS